MSENQNQESQERQKHFLTLYISHNGQQKTLHFRIRHAATLCAATFLLVSGTVCSVGAYQKTKIDLQTSKELLLETEQENRKLEQKAELLQNENKEYTENIAAIQNKTTELEQKMIEIETVKEGLFDQINNMSASTADLTAVTTALQTSDMTPTFTNIVSTSYNKASNLSAQLDKMNTLIDETGVSFTSVAEDVTYALACQNNIPNGWPVESRTITTEFNPTANPSISDGRKHCGVDITTQRQIIPIHATAAGTVTTATFHPGFGNYIVIDHYNGFTTLYAHCTELNVAVGDKVKKGDIIGTTGTTGMSTGIHCHYEIKLNGVYQNPRNYLG